MIYLGKEYSKTIKQVLLDFINDAEFDRRYGMIDIETSFNLHKILNENVESFIIYKNSDHKLFSIFIMGNEDIYKFMKDEKTASFAYMVKMRDKEFIPDNARYGHILKNYLI